ncbi:hypothetical protein HK100_008641 [Physocladia obscura]|uniref:Uncharacterized protein n=1 Tax=Physocladia obscura TaxID=109957 RepID=A0AAD5SQ80_9FUNG|nr:hypothetical protein HK100_008641 [Physocladia obscura]
MSETLKDRLKEAQDRSARFERDALDAEEKVTQVNFIRLLNAVRREIREIRACIIDQEQQGLDYTVKWNNQLQHERDEERDKCQKYEQLAVNAMTERLKKNALRLLENSRSTTHDIEARLLDQQTRQGVPHPAAKENQLQQLKKDLAEAT